MSSIENVAEKSVADMVAVLQSIAKIKGKVLHVYDSDDLIDQTKQINLPAVGVIYEGMRNVNQASGTSKPTPRGAWTAEIVISLVIAETKTALTTSNVKSLTTETLDMIRSGMAQRRGPGGHFWEFVVEAAAEPKRGSVIWLQRWKTIAQLGT